MMKIKERLATNVCALDALSLMSVCTSVCLQNYMVIKGFTEYLTLHSAID